MYGLWPGVAAIAADADMYCVPCAKKVYGPRKIQAVVDGTPGYEQHTDRERNTFGVVLNGSEDLIDMYCGGCSEPLFDEDDVDDVDDENDDNDENEDDEEEDEEDEEDDDEDGSDDEDDDD